MNIKSVSKGIRYNYLSNITTVQNACASRIIHILSKNQDKSKLILLSGGSSFSILKFIDASLINDSCTLGVLDERFTCHRENNNYYNLTQTDFYKKTQGTARYIHSMPKKYESIEGLTLYINNRVNKWFSNNPQGIVIATFGIGIDGHTAGIMPYPDDLDSFNRLFISGHPRYISYDAGNRNEFPLRITPNVPFLITKIDYGFVYVVGSEKEKIINKLLAAKLLLHVIPAQVLHRMESIELFTDIHHDF